MAKSSSFTDYTEDELIEQPAIQLFGDLGWKTANCFQEFELPGGSPLGRETPVEVVLISRLRPALEKLNPTLPPEAISQAIEEITRDRSKMSLPAANREVYHLLKDGVKVTFKNAQGEEIPEKVKVIDWNETSKNDFFLASQFWVSGEMYKRRADLVGFINGLILLSNGSQSRIGSITAEWEHFFDWKKINTEGEKGIVTLETMIRGVCEPARLLDILENFILFAEAKGGFIKLLGKNHQYLGVNNALDALREIKKNEGRLGVFWHTQGSGKSISMIFFAQKILRKMQGNWTFVIVTDRQELDNQIYKNFADAGVITEEQARAESGKELKRLLQEDHRYVFTLIQKFRTEKGEKYPQVSDRDDIIVITDEAHRSQYDVFAMNMRNALPRAAFIGFTGTPLMVGEEKTREVFGDYVSIYNFQQSVEDGATVPLYYENRIPELQLTNQDLNMEMEELLDEAMLDENQEKKLEREFAREYHLITRDRRLEKIAEDLVSHFMGRWGQGKAMVVSIDKATAVKMYDKVQKYWKKYLKGLQRKLETAGEAEGAWIHSKIEFMQQTDMAVVVSQSLNEEKELKKKGAEIRLHRKRMVKEDLDKKFKDPDDPFRIVFVCAMWMTGFDVPCCSTIYLDKPMRNHTLMQTIARANRVFRDKVNGLIVDYVGVFRNLQKALAIYAPGPGGEVDFPVKDKGKLLEQLKKAIAEAKTFLQERKVDIDKLLESKAFKKVALIEDAAKAVILKEAEAFEGPLDESVDKILINDESKRKYLILAETVSKLFRAIKPDPMVTEFLPVCALIGVIADRIRSLTPQADISRVMGDVEKLLDRSIATEGYVIKDPKSEFARVDLSEIDFEKLREKFERGRKRIEAEKLKGVLEVTLDSMVKMNRTRIDYLGKFQEMIDEYNAGSVNVEEFFKKLVNFAQGLKEEEKRGLRENLIEEELALFDLLTKPDMKLTKNQELEVKKVAKELLESLKKEKLVLDWRKRQQTRAMVRLCIEQVLDELPEVFTEDLWKKKCDLTYQHVYDSYFGEGRSIYQTAAQL